jgi:hypothetical protein
MTKAQTHGHDFHQSNFTSGTIAAEFPDPAGNQFLPDDRQVQKIRPSAVCVLHSWASGSKHAGRL